MSNLVLGLQALITLAVGICTIIALTRKHPPVEEILREEIGKLYEENKKDRATTENAIRDHERRIARLEGTCQSRTKTGKSCENE